MNTNYLYLLLSFVFICFACENEITFKAKNNPPKLILNALFEVERDTNYVSLGLTGRDYATLVDDAKVTIYINNELKEEINEASELEINYPIPYSVPVYKTTLKFLPGDLVKIEARTNDGKYHAWAEDVVPEPIEIEKVDTATYIEKSSWSSWVSTYLRIKTTFTDSPAEKNYYRLVVNMNSTFYGISGFTGKDTIVIGEYSPQELIIREDIVLNDGRPPLENSNNPLPETENRLNIFNDSRLNGTYTMNVSLSMNSWSRPWSLDVKKVSKKMKVRLISISEAQFYYLRALNLYASENFDDFLSQPISYPSNVHGGVGIFGIGAGTDHIIQLPDYIPIKNDPWN